MMGPFSGLLFIVGAIMFFVGRDRNNDELFRGGHCTIGAALPK